MYPAARISVMVASVTLEATTSPSHLHQPLMQTRKLGWSSGQEESVEFNFPLFALYKTVKGEASLFSVVKIATFRLIMSLWLHGEKQLIDDIPQDVGQDLCFDTAWQ